MNLLGKGGFSEVYKVGFWACAMLHSRYLLMSLLGKGRFSEVYKLGVLLYGCNIIVLLIVTRMRSHSVATGQLLPLPMLVTVQGNLLFIAAIADGASVWY